MALIDRCDEIIQLIDDVLGEPQPASAAPPPAVTVTQGSDPWAGALGAFRLTLGVPPAA